MTATDSPPAIGVNLPWLGNAYGHDLGCNQGYPDWPVQFDYWRVERLIALLRSRGIALVRFWLFEDGEGLCLDAHGRVVGLDQQFLDNLGAFVGILERHHMQVLWTLLDANSVRRRNDLTTRQILTTHRAMQAFIDHALGQVLRVIAPVAWAVDLCNEPEAIITGQFGNGTGLGFEWCQVTLQLAQLARAIRHMNGNLAVTAGSGFQEHRCLAAGRYDRLDLDALSFHAHAHQGEMPLATALSQELPVIVGELGWPMPRHWPHDRDNWERAQQQLTERLKLALGAGYAAIFLWFLSDYAGNAESLVFAEHVGLPVELIRPFQETRVLLGADGVSPLEPLMLRSRRQSSSAVQLNPGKGRGSKEDVRRPAQSSLSN